MEREKLVSKAFKIFKSATAALKAKINVAGINLCMQRER
jgi:hypothetical protein